MPSAWTTHAVAHGSATGTPASQRYRVLPEQVQYCCPAYDDRAQSQVGADVVVTHTPNAQLRPPQQLASTPQV